MRVCLGLIACVLAGCTSKDAPTGTETSVPARSSDASHFIPDDAELERFRREGPDPTLRQIAVADYWLHYKLMQATGLESELGGEARAVDALRALGEAYERRARGASDEIPRMVPAAFTGEGMAAGFMGMGYGSFVGLITGGLVSGLSDREIAAMVKDGPIRRSSDQGSVELQVAGDGTITQATEFEVNESGINGKVKLKMRMDSCPDESGKVTIDVDVDSQMSVQGKPGTGGFVRTQMKYERYLDDDAHLISSADGSASNLRVRMGGAENFQSQSVDITVGYERGGEPIYQWHGEEGFSIFRPEEVERARKLLDSTHLLQTLMAEAMLRGLGSKGPPWESGRCIDLQVTTAPGKRTGVEPSAAFDIEAKPRAKGDGSPAGGAVTATLTGGAQLQPGGEKVPADARYGYVAPEKKNETASIAFESRSRRGVGRATLDFDTKRSTAYRIEGGADEFHGTGVACDLGQQFFVEGSGVTVRFEPGSPESGRYSYSGTMSGFRVYGNGTYTIAFRDGVAVSMRATGPGSVVTPAGTHTRVGSEDYTLSPVESADCGE